ncbi:MAG: hypothetical protein ACLP8S_19280 [Solirubrobacteraceae bacterium]
MDRLIDDVALLGRQALPREEYFGEVAARRGRGAAAAGDSTRRAGTRSIHKRD